MVQRWWESRMTPGSFAWADCVSFYTVGDIVGRGPPAEGRRALNSVLL